MKVFKRLSIIIGLALGLAALVPAVPAAETEATQTPPVRIGMANSLFREVPPSLMMAMMQPFGALMKSQTGVAGELSPGGDAFHLGKMLAENKVQLGVLHGIEFAWVRHKHPELQPLMIAVNQSRHLHAHLVVREDNEAADLADLQGETLAMPRGTREHCRIFLQGRCRQCGQEPKKFFDKITTPSNVEDALDDVVDGEVTAAIVDGTALDCFKRRKPSRFAKLKMLQTSEVFPAGVVAYRPGYLDEETLDRFRQGMLNANKTPLGKQLLTMWKLSGFEDVPEDYEETLANIIKAYPPPTPKESKK